MSTKSDSFLQKVENGHSVHWIQKPRILPQNCMKLDIIYRINLIFYFVWLYEIIKMVQDYIVYFNSSKKMVQELGSLLNYFSKMVQKLK